MYKDLARVMALGFWLNSFEKLNESNGKRRRVEAIFQAESCPVQEGRECRKLDLQ